MLHYVDKYRLFTLGKTGCTLNSEYYRISPVRTLARKPVCDLNNVNHVNRCR